MIKKFSILIILSIQVWPIFAQNITFHLICNIDRYSNIAESCNKDFENVKSNLTAIAYDLNIPIKVYDVEFNANDSKDFIKNFSCGTNDIVFYYYSGHGFRYDDQDVVWPYMNVCKNNSEPDENCALSLNWVFQEIEKKGPRLTIAIGDCCNDLVGINEPKMMLSRNLTFRSQHEPEGYKKLFFETKGVIVASGSIPGQYSLGTIDGGIYTNSLIEVLKNSRENPSASWKLILAKAVNITEANSNKEQKPHFMVIEQNERFYSEGNYPDNQTIVFEDNNHINILNNKVNNNNQVNNSNHNVTNPNENQDYQEFEKNYDETQIQYEALYSMGLVYLLGLSADDNKVSDNESKMFYEFFNSTMTSWGYESENVDEFIDELSKWLGNMDESDIEVELKNSLNILKKYYDVSNYNTIVFDNLKIMVDNKDSQSFKDLMQTYKSL